MKSSFIVIAIVVGMIAAALAAVDSTGVSIDVPERTSAARGRGVRGVNSKPSSRERGNRPARKQVDETRVSGVYAGVRQAYRVGKTAIEEAMYAVGVVTPSRKDRYAVVSVDLPDGYRHALVYQVDNPTYRKLQPVLRGVKSDPTIIAYGRERNIYDLPVGVGESCTGGFVNPSFVIVEQVDRRGRFDPTGNVVVDGRRVSVRARVERVAKKGYCFGCRDSVRRTEVYDVTFANGREATVGGCVICGTGVYRTGSVGTEVVPVVALQGAARAAVSAEVY